MSAKSWRIGIILAVVFTLAFCTISLAARDNVVISEQNWTGSTVVCHVMKYVIETKLNVPVQIIQLNGAATWTGIEKGDVDIFSDIWETAETHGIKKFVEEKKVAEMSLTFPNAPQGWFVPKYVVEKFGIKSINDLKGKEKTFDINGDGKGDLWVGPASWKVAEQNKIRIRSYGVDFDPIEVEQWAWLAQLKELYDKKQPVVFFYWAPEWLFTQYELFQIEEEPYNEAKWKYLENDMENSEITCALPAPNVHAGYSVKLKERLPKVYQFYKNWNMPIEEVNNLIAMVTDLPNQPKLTNEEAAKKWVEEHKELVDGWMKGI